MKQIHEVASSVAARLGVAGFSDVFALPETPKYAVFLIDGLGELLVQEFADHAPFIAGLSAVPDVYSGVPSTTASSLTAIATGLPAGRHGMAGYTCRIPGQDRLMNALKWDDDVDPLTWQPHQTVFESIAAAGHSMVVVNQARFAETGLTRATSRGVPFVGVTDAWSRRDAVVEATERMDSGLVYAYESGLDYTGHKYGVGTKKWLRSLASIDAATRELRERLADDVTLIVTADHGMINLPRFNRFDVDLHPGLMRHVQLLGGEARLRHLYVEPGRADEVAARWRDVVGDRAQVRLKAETSDWFGPIDDSMSSRFGDVVVAAVGNFGVFSARRFSIELLLKGFHGSITEPERRIPVRHG